PVRTLPDRARPTGSERADPLRHRPGGRDGPPEPHPRRGRGSARRRSRGSRRRRVRGGRRRMVRAVASAPGGPLLPGPLAGIRVIDCSAVLSGPMATMMLADQGADVIKVEQPGVGDYLRLSPFSRGGLGAFFVNGNRGKRAITLDLHQPRGRELLLSLVRGADVFVQNFRPGAVEKLGIAEADLRAVRPDLVYVSISGFGESGPYAR